MHALPAAMPALGRGGGFVHIDFQLIWPAYIWENYYMYAPDFIQCYRCDEQIPLLRFYFHGINF